MNLSSETKILIVGLGQLGGGYAQALSEKGFEVGAIDIDTSSIEYAAEKKWISHGMTTVDYEYIAQFDLIISALYPNTFIQWIKENQRSLKSGALITDVTGIKTAVVYPIQEILRGDVEFIAAHPMAGRETSGVRSANKDVFSGANYIVTPTEKNTADAIEACKALGKLLGFGCISVLSPEEHDDIIGFLSQLTHCIAVSLMMCSDNEKLVDYTGDSFRDLTRIAKINDEMWSELFITNREKLLGEMDRFSENFSKLRSSIEKCDKEALRNYMKLSTERRKKFDKKS